MSTAILNTKFVTEHLLLDIDMTSRCAIGESISTSVVGISVHSGEDPAVAGMVSGVSSVANSIITQKIIDGVAGVVYKVTASGRSNLNNIYVNELLLAVRSDNALVPAALP